jgi:hypothetical protein
MRVITNNVPRDILDACELTPKERADHDYLDWAAIERGEDSASFVRYRGTTYLLSDFSADWGITRGTGLPGEFAGWDGYLSDSFFSGVVIRYVGDDCDRAILGTFLA